MFIATTSIIIHATTNYNYFFGMVALLSCGKTYMALLAISTNQLYIHFLPVTVILLRDFLYIQATRDTVYYSYLCPCGPTTDAAASPLSDQIHCYIDQTESNTTTKIKILSFH